MTLDFALSFVYLLLVSGLVAAMAARRLYRTLPVFFAYVCFQVGPSTVELAVQRSLASSVWYVCFLLVATVANALLCFCVLTEIMSSMLSFNREPRSQWNIAAWLFLLVSLVFFSLSGWAFTPERSWMGNISFIGVRASEDMQFAGLLALVLWSSLRRLHWSERELRIATGFGFSTFVWFMVSLLHAQWSSGPAYRALDQLGTAAYLVSLAYWLHYFWVVDPGVPVPVADLAGRHRTRQAPHTNL